MLGLLAAFFSSFIATLLIIRFKHLHQSYSFDWDLSGPQKFHTDIVPRIGGISVAIGIFVAILIKLKSNPNLSTEIILLICAVPIFGIGLTEDLTKNITVRLRLFFTAISAGLVIYFLQVQILKLDIPVVDLLFSIPFFGIVLTIFAITGLANAYNIIDGFNGLASMVAIITLLAIAYVSYVIGDPLLIHLSLIMAGAILGFFAWNYPRGLIFLGDGGAYLIGFWIAVLSVMLTYRHQEVSPWFALLINGYPILETLLTIYRRRIHQGKNPGLPDGVHFHTLIYRRILIKRYYGTSIWSANSRTAPYFWVITGLSVLPALIWWNFSLVLIGAALVFLSLYVWIYSRVVRFKTPKWLYNKP